MYGENVRRPKRPRIRKFSVENFRFLGIHIPATRFFLFIYYCGIVYKHARQSLCTKLYRLLHRGKSEHRLCASMAER